MWLKVLIIFEDRAGDICDRVAEEQQNTGIDYKYLDKVLFFGAWAFYSHPLLQFCFTGELPIFPT